VRNPEVICLKASFKVALVVLAFSFLLSSPVLAKPAVNFTAHLVGGNEVPPKDTLAQGQTIFMISDDETMISYRLIVANIENVTQAHIHIGAADVNGPVVAFLYGFALIPGKFSGVLAEGTITAANLVGPLAGHPLSDLITEMRAGNTYANVHTMQNPGGEVRGQIR
jgi:hypothetical protein